MNKAQSDERRFPAPFLLLLLPLLLGLPVIALSWRYGFDGLYGQDAYAYYNYAVGPLRESLLALDALAPFYWPPGYPLLVTLLSFPLGPAPLAGQIVSLVAGALVPMFTALLAYELWAPLPEAGPPDSIAQRNALWIALLSGLCVSLTPQLWQSSAVVMADTTALAAATLGVWALARYGRGANGGWLALAAAGLAYAILARLPFLPIALPATTYALLLLARKPRRLALTHATLAAVLALVILSPLLNSAIEGMLNSGGNGSYLANLETTTWSLLHALRNSFATGSGYQHYPLPNGLHYALSPADRRFFTPLLAPLLLPGLWLLWKKRTPARLLLLGAWPAVVYALLVGYPIQNFRFTLAFLPPLAIILAGGVIAAANALGSARRLLAVPLLAGLLWMAYGGWALTENQIVTKQVDLATVKWVRARVEPRARLFTFAITLTFEQYTDLQVHDVYFLTPQQMRDLLQDDRPTYLLLDVENIESQWADRGPGQNYHWLERQAGLEALGTRERYSLYRVGGVEDRDLP